MIHSTTFEVSGKLCLIACAYSEKNYEQLSLPFLCLHLNHSQTQDFNIMEYQKKCKAGLINQNEIAARQRRLQCVIATLKNTSVINPFAPLIHLPDDVPHPRKTLLLLLNFIEIITFFGQYQRDTIGNVPYGRFFQAKKNIYCHSENYKTKNHKKNGCFHSFLYLSTREMA